MLAFIKEVCEIKSMGPSGREEVNILEIRHDPLTGRKARINVTRAKRPHVVTALAENEGEATENNMCIFCEERWDETLQRFAEEGIGGKKGRIVVGSGKSKVVLVPNKYPFAKNHTIVVLGGNHETRISRIHKQTWINAFLAIRKYYECLTSKHGRQYIYINLNFMHPAGASIEHPHMQVVCEDSVLYAHHLLIEASKKFRKKHGKCYWNLLRKEDKERFAGSGDYFDFVCSFAPVANAETYGIGKRKPLDGHTKEEVKKMASDFFRMLRAYENAGFKSMNATIMFPLTTKEAEALPVFARFIVRPDPKPHYTCDRGFIEIFHEEPVIHILPEELAEKLSKLL